MYPRWSFGEEEREAGGLVFLALNFSLLIFEGLEPGRALLDVKVDRIEIKAYSHIGGELDSLHDSLFEVVQSIGEKFQRVK